MSDQGSNSTSHTRRSRRCEAQVPDMQISLQDRSTGVSSPWLEWPFPACDLRFVDAVRVGVVAALRLQIAESLLGVRADLPVLRGPVDDIDIEAFDGKPYPEDRWVSELLVCGEEDDAARLRINRRDLRCGVVNLNPHTAQLISTSWPTVVRTRKKFLGTYAGTERPERPEWGMSSLSTSAAVDCSARSASISPRVCQKTGTVTVTADLNSAKLGDTANAKNQHFEP